MTLRALPEIKAFDAARGLTEAPADAVARWAPGGVAAAAQGDETISILDVIGEDEWGGVSSSRIAAALRRNAGREVTVQINSPGGDFFEGVAIYNMLREHPAKVSVDVIGLAASAASIIAMAGDEVRVARTGFIMIHNAWAVAVGNRHDMREVADALERFDVAMRGLYAERTGIKAGRIAEMLDAETWLTGDDAVKNGFADALLASDAPTVAAKASADLERMKAARVLDVSLARGGMPRSERRSLLKNFREGTPGAALPVATLGASEIAEATRLISIMRSN